MLRIRTILGPNDWSSNFTARQRYFSFSLRNQSCFIGDLYPVLARSEEADQKAGLGVGAGAGARAKTSGDRSVAVPLLSLTVAWNKLKYIRSGQHTAQNGNFRISPNRILHDTLCLLIKFFRPFYTMYRRSLPNACEYRATFRSSRHFLLRERFGKTEGHG